MGGTTIDRSSSIPALGAWMAILAGSGLIFYVLRLLILDTQIPTALKVIFALGTAGVGIALIWLVLERLRNRKEERDDLNKY